MSSSLAVSPRFSGAIASKSSRFAAARCDVSVARSRGRRSKKLRDTWICLREDANPRHKHTHTHQQNSSSPLVGRKLSKAAKHSCFFCRRLVGDADGLALAVSLAQRHFFLFVFAVDSPGKRCGDHVTYGNVKSILMKKSQPSFCLCIIFSFFTVKIWSCRRGEPHEQSPLHPAHPPKPSSMSMRHSVLLSYIFAKRIKLFILLFTVFHWPLSLSLSLIQEDANN